MEHGSLTAADHILAPEVQMDRYITTVFGIEFGQLETMTVRKELMKVGVLFSKIRRNFGS